MCTINILHFSCIGTGDQGYFYTMLTQICYKLNYSGNIVITHFYFKTIQCLGYVPLFFRFSRKVFIINLYQRLTFNLGTEVFIVYVLLSHFIPENSILSFCIDNYTITIE